MKLSIIIPCYNESLDIVKKVEVVKNYLFENKIDAEIILVDDGSKDDTKKIIETIKDVKALSYSPNRGKGGAIKYGIENASGEYILFMDADLSTDLSAIKFVLENMYKYDFLSGSRHCKGAVIKIKQPFKRRFIGRCCCLMMNILFGFHYKDTQCGFKAIKNEVAKDIIKRQIINNFAFDVEYLYIAKLHKYSVLEFPVIWSDDRGTTVSAFKSSIKFFKDAFKIRFNKKNYRK